MPARAIRHQAARRECRRIGREHLEAAQEWLWLFPVRRPRRTTVSRETSLVTRSQEPVQRSGRSDLRLDARRRSTSSLGRLLHGPDLGSALPGAGSARGIRSVVRQAMTPKPPSAPRAAPHQPGLCLSIKRRADGPLNRHSGPVESGRQSHPHGPGSPHRLPRAPRPAVPDRRGEVPPHMSKLWTRTPDRKSHSRSAWDGIQLRETAACESCQVVLARTRTRHTGWL